MAAGAAMRQKSLRTARLDSDHDATGYGPGKCVGVQRSKSGTCVLSTHCKDDDDLEKVEFAFLCVLGNGEVQKHSYGKGGFDPDESFDTSISCTQCLLPTTALHLKHQQTTSMQSSDEDTQPAPAPAPAPVAAPAKKANASNVTAPAIKKLPVDLHTKGVPWKNESNREVYLKTLMKNHSDPTKQIAGEPAVVSLYGPEQCIQTYLGPKKTCIVETKCKADSLKDHEIGLTCVNASGKSVRHLFGKNSFHPEETFDTLIECKICLGLDVSKVDRPMSLRDSVMMLKNEIEGLKSGMEGVKADVDKLNAKVFPKADAEKPKEAQSFVTHTKERKQADVAAEEEDEENEDDMEAEADADADAAEREDEEEDVPVPVHHSHHRAKKNRRHHAAQHQKHRKSSHHKHHRRHASEYDDEEPLAEDDAASSEDARPEQAASEDFSFDRDTEPSGDAENDDGW